MQTVASLSPPGQIAALGITFLAGLVQTLFLFHTYPAQTELVLDSQKSNGYTVGTAGDMILGALSEQVPRTQGAVQGTGFDCFGASPNVLCFTEFGGGAVAQEQGTYLTSRRSQIQSPASNY